MHIEGSCHCGRVRFSCEAYAPVPYLRCYCSICRKTAGGGGYAINLGARAETLEVSGEEHIAIYRAEIEEDGERHTSTAERRFCRHCGSCLWAFSPEWPQLIHPFASCIDTPLPAAPETVSIMLDFKAPWCEPPGGRGDTGFARYPEQSLEEWHRQHRLLS
ncbi:MAG TPA: GFA family protein [Rhodanobacteraceae bacterium]|nr:GFA family protein [Rhodanobacteraceae bacterium]